MDSVAIASVGQVMVDTTTNHIPTQPIPRPSAPQKTSEIFDEWLSRCSELLQFTALAYSAGPTVQGCWRKCVSQFTKLRSGSSVRSWLLRVRIDVASAILLKSCLEESYEHANLPVASPYPRMGSLYSTENTPIENVLY
jgi:hypothetical protein